MICLVEILTLGSTPMFMVDTEIDGRKAIPVRIYQELEVWRIPIFQLILASQETVMIFMMVLSCA